MGVPDAPPPIGDYIHDPRAGNRGFLQAGKNERLRFYHLEKESGNQDFFK